MFEIFRFSFTRLQQSPRRSLKVYPNNPGKDRILSNPCYRPLLLRTCDRGLRLIKSQTASIEYTHENFFLQHGIGSLGVSGIRCVCSIERHQDPMLDIRNSRHLPIDPGSSVMISQKDSTRQSMLQITQHPNIHPDVPLDENSQPAFHRIHS